MWLALGPKLAVFEPRRRRELRFCSVGDVYGMRDDSRAVVASERQQCGRLKRFLAARQNLNLAYKHTRRRPDAWPPRLSPPLFRLKSQKVSFTPPRRVAGHMQAVGRRAGRLGCVSARGRGPSLTPNDCTPPRRPTTRRGKYTPLVVVRRVAPRARERRSRELLRAAHRRRQRRRRGLRRGLRRGRSRSSRRRGRLRRAHLCFS